MASITHLVLGAAVGQHLARRPALRPMFYLSLLSLSPDFDVIAFRFGIPYHHPLGHRGFTHSIAFALIIGVVIWGAQRLNMRQEASLNRSPLYWGVICGLLTLSHPILDAFTDGGLGVALWWPLSDERIFFSPQWIPVSPIGLGILSSRGAYVIGFESLICLPLWLYLLWPWISRRSERRSDP